MNSADAIWQTAVITVCVLSVAGVLLAIFAPGLFASGCAV